MNTEWQLMGEALTATREASDARWHLLNNVPRGTKTQEDTMEADLVAPRNEDGPEQDFGEVMEEARFALFHTYSADPGPIGDDEGYICPSHRWLPLVEEAARKLQEAADYALQEIPPALKRQARAARFVSDGWSAVVEKGNAPEARRLLQVRAVLVLLNGLVEELTNEGRPRPALMLCKKRAA